MTQAESRILHALMDRYVAGLSVGVVDIMRATGDYRFGHTLKTVSELQRRGLVIVEREKNRIILHPGEVT